MKRSIVIFIFLFVYYYLVHAAYFRSYQIENGLSHNSVWTVMQDSHGFMWFGTNDGLNRFDGKSFKIFRKIQGDETSLGNNFIHCLKEDSQGRLFIGTKEGLYLYNRSLENFSYIDLGLKENLDVSINAIMEDPTGNIWLATHGFGLYILNQDLTVKKLYKNEKNNPSSIPSNYIWSIVKDYSGGTWLGTAKDGLVFFDSQKESFTKISDGGNNKITDPTVFTLHCDTENNIWIGTLSEGLYRYNLRNGEISNYMRGEAFTIKSIIDYSDQELIMGSDKGLIKFDRNKEMYSFINQNSSFDNLTDKSIFSIIKDREGSFWIGTYFGGVNYYSPTVNKFTYYPGHSDDYSIKDIVSAFVEDDFGRIWIASNNNGLSFFEPQTRKINRFHYTTDYQNIQSLLAVKDKLYFSIFEMGVFVLDIKNNKVKELSSNSFANTNVNAMFQSSSGKIYFAMENGVSYIESESDIPHRIDNLNQIPIKWIAEDYDGSLWFASHAHGLLRLNKDGEWDRFTYEPDSPNMLPTNNINCVFQDTKFRLWIGTEGGGLLLFNNKTNCFDVVFNENSGLPSNIIYSVLDDADGSIWVITSAGIVKIDSDLKTMKSFSYIGDLQKIRPKCAFKASNNQLYLGGTYGFMTFNPKEISYNQQKPSVVLTDFQILNKIIAPGIAPLNASITNSQEIVLNHRQTTFAFNFSALSYLSPEHNQYAYMLEGYDKDWNYTTNTKASYMNIPAGEYVFRIKASNNDGLWNESENKLIVKIKPPIWFTSYMIIIYFIFIVLLGVYLIRRYNKRIDAKNREKLYKYKTEKEKEIYESKINFFTNIAHEIRTPISLIIAPLESILVSGDGNNQTKKNLEIIKVNSNRLLDLVNQLLDFRKIEENMFHFNFQKQDIVKIIRDVYRQYEQSAKTRNIDIILELKIENLECVVDAEALYKIVSNLISNAIKYAKQKVEVTLDKKDNSLFLFVKDDGIGIDKSFHNKIFEPFFQVHENEKNFMKTGSGLGLSLSQSLAMKHNGDISIESGIGQGALFILRIPIKLDGENFIEQSDDEIEKEGTDLLSEKLKNATTSGLKILIAEDNVDLRSFLVSSLENIYTVFEANNGVEALEIIENENIDIIISDIMMPEMDGLEFCNIVKTNMAYSHLPFILLSAKTDTSTKIEGFNKGADVYLEKPFSIEQLKAQINSIIENRNKLRNQFINSPLQFYSHEEEKHDNAEFIENLNRNIIENMSDEKFTIESLSGQFCMSRSNFHKKIKNITGLTPNDYIKLIRLNQSAQLLTTGKYKINEVCFLVGFNTPSYFSKCFYDHFGKLPKDFIQTKKGGENTKTIESENNVIE